MSDLAALPPPEPANGRRNPGLYPDPLNPDRRRWWNGHAWTEETAPHTTDTSPKREGPTLRREIAEMGLITLIMSIFN